MPQAAKKKSTVKTCIYTAEEAAQQNLDPATVDAFSDQWERFEASVKESDEDNKRIFERFFFHFPWTKLPKNAKGFDMGCGRGRFLKFVAPSVGQIDAVDVSPTAIEQAKSLNPRLKNVKYFVESVGNLSLKQESYDFGYSFGTLMHVPDTQGALNACVALLKPEAPFCLHIYYNLDNRPRWYRTLWKITDFMRRVICKLPKGIVFFLTDSFAVLIYTPLAKAAKLGEILGLNVDNWPLSDFRDSAFARMRGTSRDRFGTPLEKRFSREEIIEMMRKAGLKEIKAYEGAPYWCMFGVKRAAPARKKSATAKTVSTKIKKASLKTTSKKPSAKKKA